VMTRGPNRIQEIVEKRAAALAFARRAEKLLAARYGFSQTQIAALDMAQRKPVNEGLAHAFAAFGLAQRDPRLGATLRPPRTLFAPKRGQIY